MADEQIIEDPPSDGEGFRQTPLDLLFERQRPDGSSERLVLAGGLCDNPDCPCRDISYYGYVVPGAGAADLEGRALGQPALDVRLNVDTGGLAVTEGEPEIVAWLQSELPATNLTDLRQRFEEVRCEVQTHFDEAWREVDWSYWEPGMRVAWFEAHPGFGTEPVEVEGRSFILLDSYCVTEGCACGDVTIEAFELVGGRQADQAFFSTAVVPDKIGEPALRCSVRDASLARAVWVTWAQRKDVPTLLADRGRVMKGLGLELGHRWRARQPVVCKSKPAPNQRCSCGSGKKFKRCCGR